VTTVKQDIVPISSLLAIGAEFTKFEDIFIGQSMLTVSTGLPQVFIDNVLTPVVTEATPGSLAEPIYSPQVTLQAGKLNQVSFVVKTPPNSLLNYNLTTSN